MIDSARSLVVAVACTAWSMGAAGQTWTLTGPTGGDVRALAASPSEPRVVYLGTAEGVLFRSDDAGVHWRRCEPGFPLSGMSLDDIVVTPAGDVLVGYWHVSGQGGGVARSGDGGRTFRILEGVRGESVRALAVAASDPARLVAGTLSGVFASDDGGKSWRRSSPPGHTEIRNVESVAIDATDPSVIYAGTWHLPWKTGDAGRTWHPISAGMIDDSDVFTLTLDRRSAKTVFATACTGIYKSNDAGGLWRKLTGIPSSSRRTRAFAQDLEAPQTVYAGTTEGLWVSEDFGGSWSLRTAKDLVVNAIVPLPGGGLLLGSDGAGVLRSSDGGRSFVASNDGFSSRLVTQALFLPDTESWLGVVRNDRSHSGVLQAARPEGPWTKLAAGLEGREVAGVARAGHDVFAGTDGGVFVLRDGAREWLRLPTLQGGLELDPRVRELISLPGHVVVAATDKGLLRSADAGRSFTVASLGGTSEVRALAARSDGGLLAATALAIFRSDDQGASFRALSSGPDVPVSHLSVLPGDDATVFAATSSGLYKSIDGGRGWFRCYGGLPVSEIAGLLLHPNGSTVFATDLARGGVYRSDDRGESWSALATDGLMPDRVFRLFLDPRRSDGLLAATASGGLHAWLPKDTSATR